MGQQVDIKNKFSVKRTIEEVANAGYKFLEDNKDGLDLSLKKIPLRKEHFEYLYDKSLEIGIDESGSKTKPKDKMSAFVVRNFLDHRYDDPIVEEIFDIVEKNTYPYDEKIKTAWIKFYGPHHVSGLHTDPVEGQNKKLSFVTSTLIYKTEDLKGGELVICGEFPRNVESEKQVFFNISKRLKILELKELGDCAFWSSCTLHGVAEILSGMRATLVTSKSSDIHEL